jgi:hypothetical protein
MMPAMPVAVLACDLLVNVLEGLLQLSHGHSGGKVAEGDIGEAAQVRGVR